MKTNEVTRRNEAFDCFGRTKSNENNSNHDHTNRTSDLSTSEARQRKSFNIETFFKALFILFTIIFVCTFACLVLFGYQIRNLKMDVKSLVLGSIVVKHSQDHISPRCPQEKKPLWIGYSLFYVSKSHKTGKEQTLIEARSCLKSFTGFSLTRCNSTHCPTSQSEDRTYWLAGSLKNETFHEKFHGSEKFQSMPQNKVKRFISRCAVCEIPANVITLHSQNTTDPSCPPGWDKLWNGYSFLMYGEAADEGGGLSLQSSDSCLEKFVRIPFIECGPNKICQIAPKKVSFWLNVVVNKEKKASNDESSNEISRCTVCVLKRYS